MNLQIINVCAGTDPGLQIAGTDPGRRYFCCPLASIVLADDAPPVSNSAIKSVVLVDT